ncbi:hypothetical protein [Nocardioides rubriscoriae]|uniref:hypothetical protein n=1 Tax=Nocardioides rubriscoriae TaxID=642762 RepID=UPI0011DF2204|nr:hypothetical protein [Nocardioides rubriscoriae]
MTDPSTSGNRWEPTAGPAPAGQAPAPQTPDGPPPGATAVQDPPPPPPADAWAPPPVPQRRGLKDRWQHAPRGARLGAGGAVAFLLLGVGLGLFALGRGTAPDDGGQPGGVRDGHLGDRDRGFDGDGDLGGPRGLPGQGTVPGGTVPGGTLPGGGPDGFDPGQDDQSSGTTSSWYVVPSLVAGTGTSAA